MSAIAIDLGEKKVGLALEINNIAFPKKIVTRIEIIRELKTLFEENKSIDTIIIGLPYDLYNKDKKQLNKTNKFIEKLKNIFADKTIVGIDERFTTFEAKNIQNKIGKNKNEIDDISACLILESYINKKLKRID